VYWSGKPDSSRRPSAWEAAALRVQRVPAVAAVHKLQLFQDRGRSPSRGRPLSRHNWHSDSHSSCCAGVADGGGIGEPPSDASGPGWKPGQPALRARRGGPAGRLHGHCLQGGGGGNVTPRPCLQRHPNRPGRRGCLRGLPEVQNWHKAACFDAEGLRRPLACGPPTPGVVVGVARSEVVYSAGPRPR